VVSQLDVNVVTVCGQCPHTVTTLTSALKHRDINRLRFGEKRSCGSFRDAYQGKSGCCARIDILPMAGCLERESGLFLRRRYRIFRHEPTRALMVGRPVCCESAFWVVSGQAKAWALVVCCDARHYSNAVMTRAYTPVSTTHTGGFSQ